MAIMDDTTIKIVDYVSRKINGVAAKVTGARPNKAEILETINQLQADECNSHDYTFMRGTANVDGYTVSTTVQTDNPGAPTQHPSTVSSSSVSPTWYWAQKYTNGPTPIKTNTATIPMFPYGGLGALSLTSVLYIVGDNGSGKPNLNDIIASSDAVICDSLLSPGAMSDIPFTFTTKGFIAENETYWVVVKLVFGYDNGINVGIGGTHAATTYGQGCFSIDDGATWPAYSLGSLAFTLSSHTCSYNTTITIPLEFAYIYSIYPATSTDIKSSRLYAYAVDRQSNNPESVPAGSFWVTGSDNIGRTIVGFNSAIKNVETWVVEGKKRVTELVNDTDIPQIPASYRGILKYQAVLEFWALGFGQQDANTANLYLKKIEEQRNAMRREYLPKRSSGFRYNRGGGVSMVAPLDSPDPNRVYIQTGIPYPNRNTNL